MKDEDQPFLLASSFQMKLIQTITGGLSACGEVVRE